VKAYHTSDGEDGADGAYESGEEEGGGHEKDLSQSEAPVVADEEEAADDEDYFDDTPPEHEETEGEQQRKSHHSRRGSPHKSADEDSRSSEDGEDGRAGRGAGGNQGFCAWCSPTKLIRTPLWRKGPDGERICNACGSAYNRLKMRGNGDNSAVKKLRNIRQRGDCTRGRHKRSGSQDEDVDDEEAEQPLSPPPMPAKGKRKSDEEDSTPVTKRKRVLSFTKTQGKQSTVAAVESPKREALPLANPHAFCAMHTKLNQRCPRDCPARSRLGAPASPTPKRPASPARPGLSDWTPEEDELLCNLVLQGGYNWALIAVRMNAKTDAQCLHRWQQLSKALWTSEEDDLVVNLVSQYGQHDNWALIASHMRGKPEHLCRERWNTYLKRKASPNGKIAARSQTL